MRKFAIAAAVLAIAVAVFLWLRHAQEEGATGGDADSSKIFGDDAEGGIAKEVWHDHTARKIFSRLAPDVIWEFMADPGDPGEDQGKAAVRELFEEEFAKPFPDEQLLISRRFVSGELIVDELFAAGTHMGVYSGFKPSGKRVGAPALWFRWYRKGKLAKIVTYSDRVTTILRQLGHLPPSSGPVPEVPPTNAAADTFTTVSGPGNAKHIDAVKAFYAAFAKPDKSAWEAMFTENTRFHDMAENVEIVGVDEYSKQMEAMEKAFPTLVAKIVDAFAIGDFVITRVVWTGTHDGPLGKLEATGNTVEIKQAQVFRFEAGKAAEVRTYSSALDFIQQLDPQIHSSFSADQRAKGTVAPAPTTRGTKPPPKLDVPPQLPAGLPYDPKTGPDASSSAAGSDPGVAGEDEPAPEGTPDKEPAAPGGAPEKPKEGAPEPEKAPVKPGEAPEKAPAPTPEKAPEPEKAPAPTPDKAPARTPEKAPAPAPDEAPAPTPAKAPAPTPEKAPPAAPGKAPEKAPETAPKLDTP